jgi:enoyl-CoA hydratase/carnithine racemase
MAEQGYIHMPTLEDYSERFKNFFKFKRSDDGILEVRMHTFEGHVHWSYQMHHALSELWTVVGHDSKNEVLILTATGEKWIAETDGSSFKDVEDSPDDDQRFNVQIYDTLKIVENFVNDLEIPTITAINGRGIHWEMALMSDITLCTPDFILQDDHFGMHNGMVPGDGQMMALQVLCGLKRGNYLAYTTNGIDAQTCLELGAVNEIVERDRILDRAWELARMIMKSNRSTRRMTHHCAVRPWRELVEQNLRQQVYAEMYSVNLSKAEHDFDYIKYTDDKMTKM